MIDPDNPDQELIHLCQQKAQRILNPIIDWTDADIWEFIKRYDVPYCELYDEGFRRLGCIGCPMSSNQTKELQRWPKYKELYLKAFDEMLKERKKAGLETDNWETAEDVMTWWLKRGKQ